MMMKLKTCIKGVMFLFLFTVWGMTASAGQLYADPSLPIISEKGFFSIEIYPLRHELVVLQHQQPIKRYPIAVGNPKTPTPVGDYVILYKGENWGSGFGTRWLGLNVPWGSYGIHGTNNPYSIGQHLSHGCIRMRNRDVEQLYEIIPVGTKVTIYGHVLGEPGREPRKLAEGDVGVDVQLIQNRLKSAGYYSGVCNGKFNLSTTQAIRRFQRDHHLPANGVISQREYIQLGLLE